MNEDKEKVKNVDMAIEDGLRTIGLTREDVDIKILETGGLFKKAKVCLMYEEKQPEIEEIKVEVVEVEEKETEQESLEQVEETEVEDVENSSDLVEVINGISGAVKTFSVWIIVIFALVSLFIISNTIKLTVHNRRKEINIMKYVGATDSYIKGPFIMEGMLVGIVSAVIAFFISQWSYLGLMTSLSTTVLTSSFGLLNFNDIWLKLIVSYAVLGSIIGAFGSSISVRRYLKV